MAARVLVAGIGNLFLGDDGFGPEVVRQLVRQEDLPPDVKVVDYGIRGMHLAYDLLDGYGALVIVDALPGTGAAGEITVLEVQSADFDPQNCPADDFDPHGMAPVAVLASLRRLGGTLPPTYVIGCRPENVDEGMGLSEAVSAAVPVAVAAVRTLLNERTAV